jgi:hypothetical protein
MNERKRREVAFEHRGEIVPNSGVPVEPKMLDQIVSVRLPGDMAAALRDAANARGVKVSDLLRQAARQIISTPIGWRCEHFNITAPAGVLGQVTSGCGCSLSPVYHPDEIAA